MSKKICLHNGTILSGISTMEKCAVLINDGIIADVFSEERLSQKHIGSDVEIIDVDGDCGGYNLTFAFLSGYLAGGHHD